MSEHIQLAKTSSSNLPTPEDWASDIVSELPTFFDSLKKNKRHVYCDDYIIDLEEIAELADFSYQPPSNNDFKSIIAQLSKEQILELGDNIYSKTRRNVQARRMKELIQRLDQEPVKTMEEMNKALWELVVRPDDDQYEDFRLPKFNLVNANIFNRHIREINLERDEERLVQLKGWLTYVQDPPKERILYARWACSRCGDAVESIDDPQWCPGCKKETKFSIIEKRTEKFQECIITENFEDSSGFPTSLEIILSGDLTGLYSPGDRVSIVALLKSIEEKTKNGTILFRRIPEVLYITKEDEKNIVISDDDRKAIESFRNHGDILRRLGELYAPTIVGYDYIKQSIILQAAGTPDEIIGGIRRRGQIHILLIGDPGLGKSQLLKANTSAAKKSIYVSDASAAGLTAAVADINGRKVMQAGVLVLADGGIACIDEMDKMKKEDREGIHTALEQGFISKSKAGLHAHFQSRTSLLAAANPKYGKFEIGEPIADQVSIEIPLLNRFDLIFILIDKNGSEAYEIEKAKKILSCPTTASKAPDFLTKYISVASQVHPQLTEEVSTLIAHYYSDVRKKKGESTINPRTLESIKRLTLASARLRMDEYTNKEDFEAAKELIDIYLRQFDYDMDAISGITRSVRDSINWIRNLIGIHGTIGKEEIFAAAKNDNLNTRNVERAIEAMYKSGDIFEAGPGRYGVL